MLLVQSLLDNFQLLPLLQPECDPVSPISGRPRAALEWTVFPNPERFHVARPPT